MNTKRLGRPQRTSVVNNKRMFPAEEKGLPDQEKPPDVRNICVKVHNQQKPSAQLI